MVTLEERPAVTTHTKMVSCSMWSCPMAPKVSGSFTGLAWCLETVILHKETSDLYPTRKQDIENRTGIRLSTSLFGTGKSRGFESMPVLSPWETPTGQGYLQPVTPSALALPRGHTAHLRHSAQGRGYSHTSPDYGLVQSIPEGGAV